MVWLFFAVLDKSILGIVVPTFAVADGTGLGEVPGFVEQLGLVVNSGEAVAARLVA